MLWTESILYLSCALLAMSWVVWPAVLWGVSLFRRRNPYTSESDLPPMLSIVFAAHNEGQFIEAKIKNCLSLNYPSDKLQIIVISDGSTDSTPDYLQTIKDPRVRSIYLPQQGGKSLALNRAMEVATGQVVLFTDANAMLDPCAALKIVEPFADKQVGTVSGELQYVNDRGEAAVGGSFYWRYEGKIKRAESAIGCLVGGVGPIFALRRELWRPLKAAEVPDLALGLSALEAGKKSLYEPGAVCYERVAESVEHERHRYRRIIRRSIRTAFSSAMRLLANGRLLALWCLLWHKLIRYFTAPLALIAFVFALLSIGHGHIMGAIVVLVWTTVGVMAVLGVLPAPTRRIRPFKMVAYIVSMQIAGGFGVLDWALGRNGGVWRVPERSAAVLTTPVGAPAHKPGGVDERGT